MQTVLIGEYPFYLMTVMTLISTAILVVPAIAMGVYWWSWERRKGREEVPNILSTDFVDKNGARKAA